VERTDLGNALAQWADEEAMRSMGIKKSEMPVLPQRGQKVRFFQSSLTGSRSALVIDAGLGGNSLAVNFLEEDGPYLKPGQRVQNVPFFKSLPADLLPGSLACYCLPEEESRDP
jgi:hypothetical protein